MEVYNTVMGHSRAFYCIFHRKIPEGHQPLYVQKNRNRDKLFSFSLPLPRIVYLTMLFIQIKMPKQILPLNWEVMSHVYVLSMYADAHVHNLKKNYYFLFPIKIKRELLAPGVSISFNFPFHKVYTSNNSTSTTSTVIPKFQTIMTTLLPFSFNENFSKRFQEDKAYKIDFQTNKITQTAKVSYGWVIMWYVELRILKIRRTNKYVFLPIRWKDKAWSLSIKIYFLI